MNEYDLKKKDESFAVHNLKKFGKYQDWSLNPDIYRKEGKTGPLNVLNKLIVKKHINNNQAYVPFSILLFKIRF